MDTYLLCEIRIFLHLAFTVEFIFSAWSFEALAYFLLPLLKTLIKSGNLDFQAMIGYYLSSSSVPFRIRS